MGGAVELEGSGSCSVCLFASIVDLGHRALLARRLASVSVCMHVLEFKGPRAQLLPSLDRDR